MGAVLNAAPRYILNQQLAAGGMGVVYSGTMVSPAGARPIAIKRLLDREHTEANERLVAEARLAFSLTHANICQVLDLGVNDDGTFVVMELVNGVDVRSLLRGLASSSERLDIAHALYIAREVARALDYAHRRADADNRSLGLVHGDVTPSNVLVSNEGEVKLTDFGIARAVRAVAPGTGLVAGTPGYMAPESRATGGDHRSDIYSLGMTLYTMLVNERPTDSPIASRLREQRPDIGHELSAIVERATAADPQARYLSARELERALSIVLAQKYPDHTPSNLADVVRVHMSGGGAPPVRELALTSLTHSAGSVATETTIPLGARKTATAAPPRSRRRIYVAIAALLLLVAVGGVAAVVMSARESDPAARVPADPSPVAASPPAHVAPQPPAPSEPPRAPTPRARSSNRDDSARPAAARAGFLTVSSVPWGVVYVDGKRVAAETPVYKLQVAAGKHEVRVFFPDRGSYSAAQRITIESGKTTVLGFRP